MTYTLYAASLILELQMSYGEILRLYITSPPSLSPNPDVMLVHSDFFIHQYFFIIVDGCKVLKHDKPFQYLPV